MANSGGVAWRAGRALGRHGFTLTMIVALAVLAFATGSESEPLPRTEVRRWGFAPRDLFAGRWPRLLTSALVTHGAWVFVRACLMVAVFVGWAERRAGTARTAITFWGAHFTVLALLAVGVWVGWLAPVLGAPPLPRDVGPSAGALGCLGLALATVEPPRRWWAAGAVVAVLVALLFLPPLAPVDPRVDTSADLAHFLAFALGFAASLLRSPRAPV